MVKLDVESVESKRAKSVARMSPRFKSLRKLFESKEKNDALPFYKI